LKLVECVPNFSEGRRREVIDAIVSEARSRNVRVLDIESDADHNRSVLTFAGSPESVKGAALAVGAKVIELIDLTQHSGQHPRMGALDVVPFVPISDVTMEECVQLAKEFGKEYASRFNVPVFLYEEAASRPDRRNLADVRRGEFEGLREEIGKNPDKTPDFGPDKIHPTAGATAVGARHVLIAYNINLATNNLAVAKRIAKQVRGKDGGLSYVKALGFDLKNRGIVQVSMNMVNYKVSQLYKVFELARSLARHYGVQVLESEIVGLVPLEAITDSAEFYLQLRGFNKNQILEQRLFETQADQLVSLDLASFAGEVASDKPAPGGGSVSAYVGSLAAGLVSMVSRLTLKRSEYEKHWPKVKKILGETEPLQTQLLALVDEDSRRFTRLMEAYRLPKETEDQKRQRSVEIQAGLKGAAEVPLTTAEGVANVLMLAKALTEIANENALSDVETAVHMAHASVMGALANVRINLAGMKDADFVNRTQRQIEQVQRQIDRDKSEALSMLASRARG
jgi:glutamate formiminotransferase/formiminotetrahydrofolate cyclodeaminase